MESAINEVSLGVLGAPTAAKKYGIPSRTLYARMKKLGIPTAPRRFGRNNPTNSTNDLDRTNTSSNGSTVGYGDAPYSFQERSFHNFESSSKMHDDNSDFRRISISSAEVEDVTEEPKLPTTSNDDHYASKIEKNAEEDINNYNSFDRSDRNAQDMRSPEMEEARGPLKKRRFEDNNYYYPNRNDNVDNMENDLRGKQLEVAGYRDPGGGSGTYSRVSESDMNDSVELKNEKSPDPPRERATYNVHADAKVSIELPPTRDGEPGSSHYVMKDYETSSGSYDLSSRFHSAKGERSGSFDKERISVPSAE